MNGCWVRQSEGLPLTHSGQLSHLGLAERQSGEADIDNQWNA